VGTLSDSVYRGSEQFYRNARLCNSKPDDQRKHLLQLINQQVVRASDSQTSFLKHTRIKTIHSTSAAYTAWVDFTVG